MDELSYDALDDLDTETLELEDSYQALFTAMIKAMKSKTTRAARAEAAVVVNDMYTAAEAEAAYQWGDEQFWAAMQAFPKRLPLEQHKKALLEIKLQWVRPLRFLGGVSRFIERQASKAPEDAHWRRFKLEVNREVKAKSPARKAWLEANQAAHNQRQNEKRKAKRAEARAAKKAAKAGAK
jgi:hypothetical protein